MAEWKGIAFANAARNGVVTTEFADAGLSEQRILDILEWTNDLKKHESMESLFQLMDSHQ